MAQVIHNAPDDGPKGQPDWETVRGFSPVTMYVPRGALITRSLEPIREVLESDESDVIH
jgi:hypothetical protein